MSDVTETLQELMNRRLRQMGKARGRGEPLSLREVHQRLPVDERGKPVVSYETFRQISTGAHRGRITDATAGALAYCLEVSENAIFVAARQRPRLAPFRLPGYASQLDDNERRVVLGVVDAILAASERATSVSQGKKPPGLASVPTAEQVAAADDPDNPAGAPEGDDA